jgi:GDP-D-mannose 3', 5'-epimerase
LDKGRHAGEHKKTFDSGDKMKILVTGAGGFIGSHLVKYLRSAGHTVRGVDIKEPEFDDTHAHEFWILDLRYALHARQAVMGMDQVYALAADMGGIGYITSNLASIARNNSLINLNTLHAAQQEKVKRYLYTSSACVYPHGLQTNADVRPLKESDAIPAEPEPGYGWEKLYAEQLVQYYHHDFKMDTRIVRFHNVYGPLGTYQGGREKSPAAICRKVALAAKGGSIDVWGDGEQTRSYMYIADCVEGLIRIMGSEYTDPLNLGTDELVTVNQLVDTVCAVAGKQLHKQHDLTKPQGVRGRNSDNTLIKQVLGWCPSIPLASGLIPTYMWIEKQVCS